MTIERKHDKGGFIKLSFDEFFSQMSSADCRTVLNLLISDYGMSPKEIEKMFRVAIARANSDKKRIHLSNSYKIFRKEHSDGIIQRVCTH